MAPLFVFSSKAVIAVIVLIALMGARTSIAKPSSTDLLPVEAQALPVSKSFIEINDIWAAPLKKFEI